MISGLFSCREPQCASRSTSFTPVVDPQLCTATSAIVLLSGMLQETEVSTMSSCSRLEVPLGNSCIP